LTFFAGGVGDVFPHIQWPTEGRLPLAAEGGRVGGAGFFPEGKKGRKSSEQQKIFLEKTPILYIYIILNIVPS